MQEYKLALLKQEGDNPKTLGIVTNNDKSDLEQRMKDAAQKFNRAVHLVEVCNLPPFVNSVLDSVEGQLGKPDEAMRELVAQLYWQGRLEERAELMALFARQMAPKDN